MIVEPKDLHIRIIDQRIGMGVGGLDTVLRILHVPTGVLVEVPRVSNSQWTDREVAVHMIESALTHPGFTKSFTEGLV